jgi:hypothetical protein
VGFVRRGALSGERIGLQFIRTIQRQSGPKSRRTLDIILSRLRLLQLKNQGIVFISYRKRAVQFPFGPLLRLSGMYSNPLPHGNPLSRVEM